MIGWYYPDEPDLKGISGDGLPHFPTLAETGRLRVLTLSNHFYSRTDALPAGRGVYPGLVAPSDLVGFDLYPLQESCKADWLPDVATAQREVRTLAGDRPTFQWIEARTWQCHQPDLVVTPATVRAESWLAVAGGARGLGFFPADWPPDVAPGVATVSRETAALGPALLAPDEPVSATPPVVAGARSFGGAFYVFAVNPTHESVHATIRAEGLHGDSAVVVGENRSVEIPAERSWTTSVHSPSTSTSCRRRDPRGALAPRQRRRKFLSTLNTTSFRVLYWPCVARSSSSPPLSPRWRPLPVPPLPQAPRTRSVRAPRRRRSPCAPARVCRASPGGRSPRPTARR